MITVLTMYKEPEPGNERHGERAFWSRGVWGQAYLDRLEAAVARYVPRPHRYVVVPGSRAPGWWSKMHVFRYEITGGKALYLDLDTVIGGDLSALCALTPDPLIMADDVNVPGLCNGSIMLFDADRLRYLWDEYASDPLAVEARYSPNADAVGYQGWSDQAFVADRVRERGHTIPFLQQLLPPGYLRMAQEVERGADVSATHLVCGQGLPKPHQSKHPWIVEHWTDARAEAVA